MSYYTNVSNITPMKNSVILCRILNGFFKYKKIMPNLLTHLTFYLLNAAK